MARRTRKRRSPSARPATKRKRAPSARPASAEGITTAFAVVFEHHHAVALLLSPEDGTIVDANPAAAAFYGYTLAELRSKTLADIEQAPPAVVLEECRLASRQIRQRFEVPHRLASGEVRSVEVASSPIQLAGKPYLCAIVIDVSTHVEAGRENDRKTKDLASLLDVSQAMTMTLDLTSVSQMIIEKASELIGLDTGAIYLLRGSTLTLEATTPPLPPGMPESVRQARLDDHPHIQEVFRAGRPLAIEDTTEAVFSAQEQAIVEMRGLRSLLYIPLVIERRSIGVLILGSVGHPRTYRADEIDLCRTFSVQAAVTAENALMYDATTRYARELEARIVERDRAQQDRLKLETQLFESQRRESVGTLASGIAHDFNNILSIILGNASLLAAGHTGKDQDLRRIQAIITATNRATQVVTQLLTIARKTEMARRPTDLNKVVLELGKLLEETFPRHIMVRQDLEGALSPIMADPNQLHQVLLNLCVNARDAMPRGGELRLTTRTVSGAELRPRLPQAEARPYAEISVRDNGEGMDEATRIKLFTPFFTTKGVGKGTGLGLAVSLGIVESHGGFMEVTSSLGQGSIFRVYLPSAAQPWSQPSHVGPVDRAAVRGTETILLVDDEPLLRESAAEGLAEEGYEILTAGHGDEALEIYRKNEGRIALVLSDYGLPTYDGEELYRRLRAVGARMPFVLMTGFVEVEKKGELLQLGVRDIVMKPFEPGDVVTRIRRLLDEEMQQA